MRYLFTPEIEQVEDFTPVAYISDLAEEVGM